MPVLEILKYPHPTLRKVAEPVRSVTKKIQRLADDMAEIMYSGPGIGLAAPQVGSLIRLIVIDVSWRNEGGKSNLITLINPEIISVEGERTEDEGCLSIPGIIDKVKRADRVVVRGLDKYGKDVEIKADGMLATTIQHEIDHLSGILFLDHLSRIKRGLYKKRLKKGKI